MESARAFAVYPRGACGDVQLGGVQPCAGQVPDAGGVTWKRPTKCGATPARATPRMRPTGKNLPRGRRLAQVQGAKIGDAGGRCELAN